MRVWLPLFAIALAGCSWGNPGGGKSAQVSLAKACQVAPCKCIPADATFESLAKSTPPLWHSNGDAYCPEGQVLRREK